MERVIDLLSLQRKPFLLLSDDRNKEMESGSHCICDLFARLLDGWVGRVRNFSKKKLRILRKQKYAF
jgi:hypothetical protein